MRVEDISNSELELISGINVWTKRWDKIKLMAHKILLKH